MLDFLKHSHYIIYRSVAHKKQSCSDVKKRGEGDENQHDLRCRRGRRRRIFRRKNGAGRCAECRIRRAGFFHCAGRAFGRDSTAWADFEYVRTAGNHLQTGACDGSPRRRAAVGSVCRLRERLRSCGNRAAHRAKHAPGDGAAAVAERRGCVRTHSGDADGGRRASGLRVCRDAHRTPRRRHAKRGRRRHRLRARSARLCVRSAAASGIFSALRHQSSLE